MLVKIGGAQGIRPAHLAGGHKRRIAHSLFPQWVDQRGLFVLNDERAPRDLLIEIAELVRGVVEGRVDFVSEADIHRKIRRHAPFVLRETTEVVTERLPVRPVLRLHGIVDSAQQESGESLRVAAAVEVVAVFIAQVERNVVLIVEAAIIGAELQRVAPVYPGDVVSNFESAILVHARVPVWISLAAQNVTKIEHRSAAQPILGRAG